MRAVNDHAVGNSVEMCKDESKPHQCPEEKWEDVELKIAENGKMNNNNVCELFYDTRSGDERDKENDVNGLERRSCGDFNEVGKKLQNAIGHDIDAKVDPVIYMDKNVTACDLPEIVVCFKDNTYHVVKDICVDEGVPVQEKFLFGEKDSVKCSSDSNQCESEDLMKAEKVNVTPLETKSLEDGSEVCNDHKTSQDVEEHSREVFSDADGSSICNQEHLIATREANESPPCEIFQEIEADENSKDEVAAISLTLGDILSREDEEKPLKSDRLEEHSLTQLQDEEKRSFETAPLETELKETEELGKAEQKLSSVSTTPSQEPGRTCNDPEKPETENQQQNNLANGSNEEDDKRLSSSFGKTSFSAADAVSISGHITYSGPIAFSGSLSVRSDASTTSARSFAFPILQSEWNSSPVRMKKAGKRSQKGWKQTLLCCRFS